jgi:hypothetical protein
LDRGTDGADNIVIFQAKNPGKAVISGSKRYRYYSAELADSRISSEGSFNFSLPWTHKWGLSDLSFWKLYPDGTNNYHFRREMLFINGNRLMQVLSDDKLSPGKFYVDEGQGKIIFQPPTGITLNSNTRVEAAVRGFDPQLGQNAHDGLFTVIGQSNLVFRGLVFQHAASYQGAALVVDTKQDDPERFPSNILIEKCKFQQNNYEGLSLRYAKNFTVKNSVFDENGVAGAYGRQMSNGEWLDCQFTRNNWRGGQLLGGHHGAGFKTLDGDLNKPEEKVRKLSDGVQFVRCRFANNKALGFWQDYGGDNFTMNRCLIEDNYGGIMREMTHGTFAIKNCVIRNNFNSNVVLYASSNTTLDNCYIYGAKPEPLQEVQYVKQFNLVWDARENGGKQGSFANTTIKNCTIQANIVGTQMFYLDNYGKDENGKLINFEIRKSFLDTLTSDHNRWWRESDKALDPNAWWRGESDQSAFLSYYFSDYNGSNAWRNSFPDIDFTTWQRLTPPSGRSFDANSKWEKAELSAVPDPILQFPNGLYRVSPVHAPSKALDVADASTDDQANIQQWEWWGGSNQRWQVERMADGSYRLLAWHSNKALEAKDAGTIDGTLVQQNSWNGGCEQRWNLDLLEDGSYKVRSACSNIVLDVSYASQDDGALIHLWSPWDGTNQQWTFEPMP